MAGNSKTWILMAAAAAVLCGSVVRVVASPYPTNALTPLYEKAADYILAQTGLKGGGHCIVFGAGEGRLAYHLSMRSDLVFFGIEESARDVTNGRTLLDDADIYGSRISLAEGSLTNLSCRDYAAALVVSDSLIEDGACRGDAAEMYRMVRPDGGLAFLGQPAGCPNRLTRDALSTWLDAASLRYTIADDTNGVWARVERGALPGAGEWTHQYADAANTACSGDVRMSNTNKVLWFGGPGPRVMVDRHWKPSAPMYKKGRFVVLGDDHIVCCDAYNGARLWDLLLTNATRMAMLRDASWIVAGEDYLYMATGTNCRQVALENGAYGDTFPVASPSRDWGYVALDGDLLLGSEQLVGASRITTEYHTGGAAGNQIARGVDQSVVTSRALFCRHKQTARLLWTYEANSVIANPCICVGSDAVYFLETHAPGALSDADGRVTPQVFTEAGQQQLVKLNKTDGAVQWRKPHDLALRHIMYLSYAANVILVSGTDTSDGTFRYHYRAYDSRDGSFMWGQEFNSGSRDSEHGFADRHPIMVDARVYTKFASYDLRTGDDIGFTFGANGKCADSSASATHLYGRYSSYGFGGAPAAFELAAGGKAYPLSTAMRPGCHLSIIPAGGIVLMPSYSAGCTCGYTLQTTIGWLPQ